MATIAPFFMMLRLNLVILRVVVAGGDAASLLPLFSGRGAVFEAAVRQLGCRAAGRGCAPGRCVMRPECPVQVLIARQLSGDPHLVRRHQKPGLPYAVSDAKAGTPESGAVSFRLVVLGSALPHADLLVRSIAAVSGGVCRLQGLDYQMTSHPLARAADKSIENLPVLDAAELMALSRPDFAGVRNIRIDLSTPMHLLHNGREIHRFEPGLFLRAMLRRISALAACYGEGADPEWFRQCAVQAGDVRVISTLSDTAARSGERGVVGSYELAGAWQELGPLLRLGSLLNVGKGASYGRGAFQVAPAA